MQQVLSSLIRRPAFPQEKSTAILFIVFGCLMVIGALTGLANPKHSVAPPVLKNLYTLAFVVFTVSLGAAAGPLYAKRRTPAMVLQFIGFLCLIPCFLLAPVLLYWMYRLVAYDWAALILMVGISVGLLIGLLASLLVRATRQR